jgi:hypothetical protein
MSANFDARFDSGSPFGFGYRVGVGTAGGMFLTEGDDITAWTTYYTLPLGINYVFGKMNDERTFEVGFGVTFLSHQVDLYTFGLNSEPSHTYGFFTFVYRTIPMGGGFSYRLGLTPRINMYGNIDPVVSAGFGFSF